MLQPPACMSMKTHDDAPEVVMDAPGGVPKNNELKGRQFFVRKCYPEYYKLQAMLQIESERICARYTEDFNNVPVVGPSQTVPASLYIFSQLKALVESLCLSQAAKNSSSSFPNVQVVTAILIFPEH